MTYRDELNRPADCSTAYADGLLAHMEAGARCHNTNQAARLIGTHWLSVFVLNGELAYNWQGGYPTNIVSRDVALSVLVRA